MKKIISIFLVIVWLLLPVLNIIATAAETPQIAVDRVNAERGEEVEVKISLKNNTGIASLKLQVSFDSDLKLKSVVYNEALGGQSMLPQKLDPNKTNPVVPISGPIVLNWFNGIENMVGDMDFATLTFVVDENASFGLHNITLTYDEDDVYCILNGTEENLNLSVMNGGIMVTGEDSPKIVIGSTTGIRGAEAEIRVSLQNNTGIASLKLAVSFDSDLKLKSVVYNEALDGQSLLPQKLNPDVTNPVVPVNSPVILNWYNGIWNVVGDMIFATLIFVIDDNASVGEHTISITYDEDDVFCFTNGTEKNVSMVVVDGSINVPDVYTVTFKNYDGTGLKEQIVEHGKSATAPDEEPTRDNYKFTGWDKDFTSITSNLVITAQFSINTYAVFFKNYDGTTLKKQMVEHGSAATPPGYDPKKENHHFIGWDKDFSSITSYLVVTAQFEINTYTVTFKNFDGSVLKEQIVEHGKSAAAPNEEPTKENHHFIGWDKDFSNITGNLVVIAQFEINTYVVTFKNIDGTVFDEQVVEYGSAAIVPDVPEIQHYAFVGWDTSFDNVTTDLTVTAMFEISHTYAEIVAPENLKTEANCVSSAIYYKSCSFCGDKSEETFTYGNKNPNNHLGGTHVENAMAATFTSDGYTGDTVCDSCGAIITKGTKIDKLDSSTIPLIYGSNKTVMAGDTFTVDVMLKNTPGINYLGLDFNYDSNALTLTGVTPTSIIGTSAGIQNIDKINGKFSLIWANASNKTSNGTIVTLTFTVNENADVGSYDINMSVRECYNDADDDVDIYTEKISVKVINVLIGDVNGDGKINGKDATRLLQHLAHWDNVVIDESASDTNGDGKINGKDATRLLQYLAHWDVVLGKYVNPMD